MIISRTPMRVSFLGGTTDFPEFFRNSVVPGRVLGTTIDKYVYVNVLEQPKFETIKFRFSWRFTESVADFGDITHPVVRKILELDGWERPLNISTMASLPGRSGLGSSSAFTVGLLGAMSALRGANNQSLNDIAQNAIRIEREELGEAGGWQDQFQCAIGGFRKYTFTPDGVDYSKPIGDSALSEYLSTSLVLIATGGGRDSFIHAQRTRENIMNGRSLEYLGTLSNLTEEIFNKMQSSDIPEEQLEFLSHGMRLGWGLKRRVSSESNKEIDEIINFGISKGAMAGKLCGAGGSGFAAFLVRPKTMPQFTSNFPSKNVIRVKVANRGQEIIQL